jgi:glycosyltransferase involved in cell wall biosynthesis
MRVAIATGGRFHVLDLARELLALGHEVRFYSYVPVKRAEAFGLPAQAQRCLLPYVFPLVGLLRIAPKGLRPLLNEWLLWFLDWVVAWKLEPCDVFIGMSGLCVASCSQARRKYGAKVLLERGSTHILHQKETLEKLKGGARVSAFDIRRELAGYALADLVVIPSLHVEDSFLQKGFPKGRLFRNPYGVNLDMFPSTPVPESRERIALFVGGWSYRKGCELWAEVLDRLPDLRLMHVGGRGDAPFPNSPRFSHVDPVDQKELPKYYTQAHLFVLASREEGLSLVLIQALSSGLPLVCTDQTGGRDLFELTKDENLVRVVPVDDLEALCAGIQKSMAFALGREGLRTLPGSVREKLTWRSYGERYSNKLIEIMGGGK